MKPFLLLALVAAALSLSACYYDPYSSGWSGGGYYSGGTSFVYTSSSYWVYDPWVRCYYDRRRHCYYDPWLNGYYPRGYCPRPVRGVPHPYGWNGRGKCPPPRGINSRYLDNRRERVAQLRRSNHDWANQVRAGSVDRGGNWSQQRLAAIRDFGQNPGSQNRADNRSRDNRGNRPDRNASGGFWSAPNSPAGAANRGGNRGANRQADAWSGNRRGNVNQGQVVRPNTRASGGGAARQPQRTPQVNRQVPPQRQGQVRSQPTPSPQSNRSNARSRGATQAPEQGWSRLQQRR